MDSGRQSYSSCLLSLMGLKKEQYSLRGESVCMKAIKAFNIARDVCNSILSIISARK